MGLAEDLSALMVGASLMPATSIFTGRKASIPSGTGAVGPYASIVETGGTAPESIQNTNVPAYRYPACQLTFRASTGTVAWAKARAAWLLISQVRNQTVNGTRYRSIKPLQEPFDGGVDDKERPTVKFNVIGDFGS